MKQPVEATANKRAGIAEEAQRDRLTTGVQLGTQRQQRLFQLRPHMAPSERSAPYRLRDVASPDICLKLRPCTQPRPEYLLLPKQDEVVYRFVSSDSVDELILYCDHRIITRLALCPQLCLFKIGIAIDPHERWNNKGFGYQWSGEGWMWMEVLGRGAITIAKVTETQLIVRGKRRWGCTNVAPGGEGISDTCALDTYVYCVFSPLDMALGPPKRAAVMRRAGNI